MLKKVTSAKLFSSVFSCTTVLNNVGTENILAMELAPHQDLIQNKYIGFNLDFEKNDLYKYIESTISKIELESLKSGFIKDNLAGKSTEELLGIFGNKSLRFLVLANMLILESKEESAERLRKIINEAWSIKLNKLEDHCKKVFENFSSDSLERYCVSYLKLDGNYIKQFNLENLNLEKSDPEKLVSEKLYPYLEKLVNIQYLLYNLFGEKYCLETLPKYSLMCDLALGYFNVINKMVLPDIDGLLSIKDYRNILKFVFRYFNFYLVSVKNVEDLNKVLAPLYFLSSKCSNRLTTSLFEKLIEPTIKNSDIKSDIEWFKENYEKMVRILDKEFSSGLMFKVSTDKEGKVHMHYSFSNFG